MKRSSRRCSAVWVAMCALGGCEEAAIAPRSTAADVIDGGDALEQARDVDDAARSDTTGDTDIDASDVIAPDVIAPDVIAPDVIAPDVIAPDVIAPDVIAPDVIAPDVIAPDVTAPDVASIVDAAAPSWTWNPVVGTRCGNGSTAGYGLRRHPGSRSLMVFMMGGGACWDGPTCFGPALLRAVHVDDAGPYDERSFRADLATFEATGLTDRADAENPFRDANMVFIPYCTGDVHAGDRVATYDVLLSPPRTVYHQGARNMTAFLTALSAGLPDVDRVWLLGASAGGYGALFNAPRVQAAFTRARVDVLADGAPMITPWGGQRDTLARAWALPFPSDCPGCATRWEEYVPWLSSHLAAPRRAALITYAQDPTIGAFFGYPLADDAGAISWMLAHDYPRAPRSGFFVIPGAGHVALDRYRSATGVGGASLRAWVRAWATDDPAWRSVGP